MRIRILSSALRDLQSGRNFYEKQAEGLGDYFYNSLFSEIDSLQLYGEFIARSMTATGCWPAAFPMRSIIKSAMRTEKL